MSRRVGLLAALAAAASATAAAAPARSGELDAALGRALFARAWVPAPSSTGAADGLGPLHNARSCAACHAGLARAPVRAGRDGAVADEHLVLKVSDRHGRPDPVYGAQIQTGGLTGVPPEARPALAGSRPVPRGLAYGPLAPTSRVGARLAPPLAGLGRLAEVPEAAILAVAAEQSSGRDGVRGRPNWVGGASGTPRIGRFGLKGSAASLPEQVETAFKLDLGMSTPGHPRSEGDCTPAQTACRGRSQGGDAGPEIGAEIVRLVAAFLAGASPPVSPAREDGAGTAVFAATGCANCHRPSLPSAAGPVRAFTDLLLHDLGPALDGGATEPGVRPTEWRTAPLWGVSRALEAKAGLLHDGRARTVAEAVRLHGGEAATSRALFDRLPDSGRKALLDYVGTL